MQGGIWPINFPGYRIIELPKGAVAVLRIRQSPQDAAQPLEQLPRAIQQGNELPILIVVHQGKGGGQGIVKGGQVEEGGGQQDKGGGRPSGGGKAAWQKREHHPQIIPPARGGN